MRTVWKWMLRVAAVLALVFLLAPYLVPLPERSPVPEQSPYPNGGFAEACGTRWHLQRWPAAAEPRGLAVLIHGFAGSSWSWRLTAPALAEAGWDVLAVDLPPYGFSDRSVPDDSIPACLAGIVQAESRGRPVLSIGHSMGASVTAALAARLREQARALVLVDGGLGGSRRGSTALATLLQLPPLARWAEVAAHYRMLRPEAFADTLASAYGRRPLADELEGYRRPLLLAGTAPAVLSRPAMAEPVQPADLPAEVLIVWGREDRWVPPRVAEATHARVPQSRLAWIESAGHNPMETHPEDFMRLLLTFLQGPPAPTQTAPDEAHSDQHGEHAERPGQSA